MPGTDERGYPVTSRRSTSGYVHVGWAAIAVTLAVWAAELPAWQILLAVLAGAAAGAGGAELDGRRLERSVDAAGGIVLYSSQTIPHVIAPSLGLMALSPAGYSLAMRMLQADGRVHVVIRLALCAMAGGWLAYDLMIGRRLKSLESRYGRLDAQWFYAESVVGPEGLLGREALVATDCAPRGVVIVDAERWQAESLDGSVLRAGTHCVIRRVRGLTLVVQATADGSPANRAKEQRVPS